MTKIEPRQAWVNWAQQFLAAPREPLDTQEQTLFAACLLTNDPDFPGEEVKRTFMFRLIEKRMAVIGLSLDTPAMIYLSVTHDNPGTVVMYLYATKYSLRAQDPTDGPKEDSLTLSELAHIFPDGFVAKRCLQELWDAQKAHRHNLPGDNLLDSLGYGSLWVPPTAEDAQEAEEESDHQEAGE